VLSTIKRRRPLRGFVVAVACASAFAVSAPAGASVTIGQLPSTAPDPNCSSAGNDYLQTSVTGGTLYSARAAGTITSWSTNSQGAGATFSFKVFRRTSDPDFFQVVGRTTGQTLTAGVNTFPTSVSVESGDLIGIHAQGGVGGNSCTFPVLGDGALTSPGDLAVGDPPAQFSPLTNVRLNLSAVLNPSNAFTITGLVRHRRGGTATLTVALSNPGLVTVGGVGLKKRHATTAVASSVTLKVATVGKSSRKLARKGHLKVPVAVTFFPTGGDPSSQTIPVKLVQKRILPAV
jgi:hypothetical protein